MDIWTGMIIIGIIYGILFFFDLFFKSCALYPYIKILDKLGLQLGFLTIKWRTKSFNRLLFRYGNTRPHFLKLWFTLGTYASIALLPISILLFIYSIYQASFVDTGANVSSEPVISALIPGVNLPISELTYYTITLLICSVVHELGHALAAISENINLEEIGLSIFFILPVAYVKISTENLFSLNKRNTLRVLCAGIWHNIVITFIAFLFYNALPFIFSPMYFVNRGVSVSQILPVSPLVGPQGLFLGDNIVKINHCNIYNENSWYDCLKTIKSKKPSFCIGSEMINNLDESIPPKHSPLGHVECCDTKYPTNICFEYVDSTNIGILEMPSHVCLQARTVAEKSTFCTPNLFECPTNTYCYQPSLNNLTNMFKIVCDHKDVIYIGHVSDLYYSIEVSSYISKNIFTSTTIPDITTKFLKYIVVISLGLGIVNIFPIIFMDGDYILNILIHLLFGKRYTHNRLRVVSSMITTFFSVLFMLYLVHSVYCKIF